VAIVEFPLEQHVFLPLSALAIQLYPNSTSADHTRVYIIRPSSNRNCLRAPREFYNTTLLGDCAQIIFVRVIERRSKNGKHDGIR
jgi:hypothetical protein